VKRRNKDDRFTRISDFGSDLRGLGGLQTSHIRALKGSTLGPANRGRRLSAEERRRVEEQMKKDGKL
jgi:hypothetical protein